MPNSFDLSSNQASVVSSSLGSIANIANQFIVRPTGGTITSGINGFVFDILGEEEVTLESEITDHYVEDNYAIQDHIAQKPIRYIAKGYVGELYNIFPSSLLSILTAVQNLDAVPGIAPVFSAQANQVYNNISSVGNSVVNVVSQAKNFASLLSGYTTAANKQQTAYLKFLDMWQNRVQCSIETPWGVLYSMYVEKITPMQSENTRIISEFSVSFKQLRFTSTITAVPLTISNLAGSGVKSISNTSPYNLPSNFAVTS